jgi:dTDP-glucose pyrophosphorylase
VKVIVPMAGSDEAFKAKGYTTSKNLIELEGKPLVQHAYENLSQLPDAQFIFIVRKEEVTRHHLAEVLKLLAPQSQVVRAQNSTAGAACTALLAIEHIVPDEELVIANGDQVIQTDLAAIISDFRKRNLDGGTIVFDSVHPRWSYVRLNDEELVREAAEKRPISRNATAGFYYFRRGADFLTSAVALIRKDASVNGQFYVCPAFNEMILRQMKIGIGRIDRDQYFSFATPQGVELYELQLSRKNHQG